MPFAPVRYTRLVPVASVNGAPDAAGLSWGGVVRVPANTALAETRLNAASAAIVRPSAVRERLVMRIPPRDLVDAAWYVSTGRDGFAGLTNRASRRANSNAHATIVASMSTTGTQFIDSSEARDQRRIDRNARLPQLLRERILVLDGAMGTLIQRHGFGEADFRSERFGDHPQDLKGANDMLVLT